MRQFIDLIVSEGIYDDPTEREVLSLIRQYRMSPKAINNGWCWGFANQLAKRLGDQAEVISTTGVEGVFPGHSVVLHNGKYYDAESPRGVSDMKDLHYSKRIYALAAADPSDDDD